MELNSIEVSERIITIMQQLGCNQNEFAERLHVTQPAVSKYLNGRIPPAHVLLKLAQISDTSIEWILNGESMAKPGYVAEPVANYQTGNSLLKKIQSFPEPVRKQIEGLIDEIDHILKK